MTVAFVLTVLPACSTLEGTQRPFEDAPAPAVAEITAMPMVMVAPVGGPPPEVGRVLAELVASSLRERDIIAVTRNPSPGALLLTGRAEVLPQGKDLALLRVSWSLTQPDGLTTGTFQSKQEVPVIPGEDPYRRLAASAFVPFANRVAFQVADQMEHGPKRVQLASAAEAPALPVQSPPEADVPPGLATREGAPAAAPEREPAEPTASADEVDQAAAPRVDIPSAAADQNDSDETSKQARAEQALGLTEETGASSEASSGSGAAGADGEERIAALSEPPAPVAPPIAPPNEPSGDEPSAGGHDTPPSGPAKQVADTPNPAPAPDPSSTAPQKPDTDIRQSDAAKNTEVVAPPKPNVGAPPVAADGTSTLEPAKETPHAVASPSAEELQAAALKAAMSRGEARRAERRAAEAEKARQAEEAQSQALAAKAEAERRAQQAKVAAAPGDEAATKQPGSGEPAKMAAAAAPPALGMASTGADSPSEPASAGAAAPPLRSPPARATSDDRASAPSATSSPPLETAEISPPEPVRTARAADIPPLPQPSAAPPRAPGDQSSAPPQPKRQPAVAPAPAPTAPPASPAPASPAGNPAAPVPVGPINAVMVAPVQGAPGNGDEALTRAIKDALRQSGLQVPDYATPETVVLHGRVNVEPAGPGSDRVTIEWALYDAAGHFLGTVTQRNQLPRSMSQGRWDGTAAMAARGAVAGIRSLIDQARAGGSASRP